MINLIYSTPEVLKRKNIAQNDNFFFMFEDRHFKNDGDYPRNTNLVIEFCDWVDGADDEIVVFYNIDDEDDISIQNKKSELVSGCNKWLGDDHHDKM